MNFKQHDTQHDNNSRTVAAQARYLMSAERQRIQCRSQAILNRTATEIGLDS
jgi:hypothetical protein